MRLVSRPVAMAPGAWRPDWRTALPPVFYVRWWLYRLATIIVILFFGAAAMLPPELCGVPVIPGALRQQIACDLSWRIPPRLEIAAAGLVLAFAITFVGARLDLRVSRRRRGRAEVTRN